MTNHSSSGALFTNYNKHNNCDSSLEISTKNNLTLNIFYFNCSGMRGKIKEFYIKVKSSSYNVIVLTETWLNSSFLNSEILDSNWIIYRKDRDYNLSKTSRGGGVLIAVHTSIISEAVDVDILSSTEIVFTKLKFLNKQIFISSIYVPPSSNDDAYNNIFDAVLHVANMQNENDNILIFGDFNRPNLNFISDEENIKLLLPINITSDIDSKLIETFYGHNMYQIFNIKNSNNKFLDLCFSNIDYNFDVREADDNFHLFSNTYHHKGIIINFDCMEQQCSMLNNFNFKLTYDFYKADYLKINEKLSSIDWEILFNKSDLETCVKSFETIIISCLEEFVPKKIIKENNEPWLNKHLKNLRNKRNRAYKHFKKYNDTRSKNTFDSLSKNFESESILAYNNYCKSVGDDIIFNPKKFFKFVDVKRKCRGFPSTMKLNDTSSSIPLEISNLFAHHFQNSYTDENSTNFNPNDFNNLEYKDELVSSMNLTEDEILTAILKLNSNKGPGPDEMHPSFLINCANQISIPLLHIFNLSLNSGIFPQNWKYSFLTPIFKSGNRNDIQNYRGIAILSAIPKLFEKLICHKLTEIVSPFLNKEQHGFIKNRSTITNLSIFTSTIITNMEKGYQTDAIYTDFSKAFDRVSHNVLILKLKYFGIRGSFLKWIKCYLTNRRQRVKFLDVLSNIVTVFSGVPQGSHLGPLLFIIFISDLSKLLIGVDHLLYADDLKIFYKILTSFDASFLQNILDRLNQWCEINKLSLNIKKCSVITYTRKKDFIKYDYTLNNELLQRVDSIKDLGILLDTKLNFNLHYDAIFAKAHAMLGFIKRRASEFNNIWVTKTLYCSLVRSILEYGSVVWNPHHEVHIKKIESIQKKFLLYILNHIYSPRDFNNLPSYLYRLNIINMKTLEGRRDLLASCFIFDVLKRKINITFFNERVLLNNDVRQTRHTNFLKVTHHRTDYGKNEPINRAPGKK